MNLSIHTHHSKLKGKMVDLRELVIISQAKNNVVYAMMLS